MNQHSGQILVNDILPILAGTIPRAVRTVGHEDPDELIQDALADSAKALQSLEDQGRSMNPGSVAYYSIQRLKSGRRSYSAGTTDVMSAGCQIRGGITVESFDQAADYFDSDDEQTLADVLYDRHDDPSVSVCRELDWNEFLGQLPERESDIIRSLADGHRPSDLAYRHRISRPRLSQIKREMADRIRSWFGEDVLEEAGRDCMWQRELHQLREKRAGRK